MTIQEIKAKLLSTPRWRHYVFGGVAVLAAAYLAWCHFAPKPLDTKVFAPTKAAVSVPKVAGPTLAVPIKVVPKAVVQKKFPTVPIAETEEIIDTAQIPKAKEGGVTITKIDTVTGEATTDFKPNPAPWFAFEKGNILGAGMTVDTSGGKAVPVYYKRDFVRVKDLHLVGEVGAKVPVDGGKLEGHAGALLEYRW